MYIIFKYEYYLNTIVIFKIVSLDIKIISH